MKKKNSTHRMVEGAVIAALYIVLTYSQELLFPGTTSMAIQFRLSEILLVLCVYTPSAIWGLTVGTLISNLLNVGALPLDIVIGTFATFVAASTAYMFRNVRFFSLPILSALMPVLANGILIGLEIEIFFIAGPFHLSSFLLQSSMVAIGEFGVCVMLGLPFFKLLEKINIQKTLHN